MSGMLGYFSFFGLVMDAAGAGCLLYEWRLAFASAKTDAVKHKTRPRKVFPLPADEKPKTEEVAKKEVDEDTKGRLGWFNIGLWLLLGGFLLQATGNWPVAWRF